MADLAESDNKKTRQALYQSFLKSSLFVPGTPPENPQDQDHQIEILKNSQGQAALAVFTSREAAIQWKEEVTCIAASGREIAALADEAGVEIILINMAGPDPRGFLTRAEIQLLIQGFSAVKETNGTITAEASREISVNIEEPPGGVAPQLERFLRLSLDCQPAARAAYLFQATYEGGDPHLVLGVEAQGDENDLARWLESMATPIAKYLPVGQYMDFMLIDRAMAEKIQEAINPLWQRA